MSGYGARSACAKDGYRGSLVPAGPGSIAVLGDARIDLSEVTARVVDAVEWTE